MNILRYIFSSDKELQETSNIHTNFEVTPQEQIEFASGAIEIFSSVTKTY